MLRSLLLTACLFLPAAASAEWHLASEGFSHRIVTDSPEGHVLSVDTAGKAASLNLRIMGNKEHAPTRWPVTVRVDGKPGLQGELAFLNAADKAGSASLQLADDQKITLLHQMVAGLQLAVTTSAEGRGTSPLVFSLIGFTAALNDLLIANRVGKLDFEWLFETHQEQELFCLYAATLTVKVMADRNRGQSRRQTLASIRPTGVEMLDAGVAGIVDGVYRMPLAEVPREPNGEKYGIFLACLKR